MPTTTEQLDSLICRAEIAFARRFHPYALGTVLHVTDPEHSEGIPLRYDEAPGPDSNPPRFFYGGAAPIVAAQDRVKVLCLAALPALWDKCELAHKKAYGEATVAADIMGKITTWLDQKDDPTKVPPLGAPSEEALDAVKVRLERVGHGHVWRRADGGRMRCGGYQLCMMCKQERVDFEAAGGRLEDR